MDGEVTHWLYSEHGRWLARRYPAAAVIRIRADECALESGIMEIRKAVERVERINERTLRMLAEYDALTKQGDVTP